MRRGRGAGRGFGAGRLWKRGAKWTLDYRNEFGDRCRCRQPDSAGSSSPR